MKAKIHVGPLNHTLHLDDEVLICDPSATMSKKRHQGYFISDTRMVSDYTIRLGSSLPVLLNSSAVATNSERFEFTNDHFTNHGVEIPKSTLHLRLDRVVDSGIHEDYEITNYSNDKVDLSFALDIESDFADLFEVKEGQVKTRGKITTNWNAKDLTLSRKYENSTFERTICFEARNSDSKPDYADESLVFRVQLAPRESWHTCLLWRPIIGSRPEPTIQNCHNVLRTPRKDRASEALDTEAADFELNNLEINATVKQATDDLVGLQIRLRAPDEDGYWSSGPGQGDLWVTAAGVPWFVSVFGRDALVASLQSMHVSYKFAEGSLNALSFLQATETDDERDMQPGKIEHELRRGELAELGIIPHTPYYGTHDATAYFVLIAATHFDWNSDRKLLDKTRPHVEAALGWIDKYGDLDGDGIQEYETKSSSGYFNQGWKDDPTAIVQANGDYPPLPIAVVEDQGLVVAAKRKWAQLLSETYGEKVSAQKLFDEANRLSEIIEEKFFWEEEGTYYLGLDGNKQPIKSVASNAGQLLYFEAIDKDRAKLVAERLLRQDMWSGWGIRTLSSEHPSYNPFSYQTGSVWPHDNGLIAAGMRKYGFDEEAHLVAKALFDAAECFEDRRLPELFAGLERDYANFPVQILGANVPQAWASGAVLQTVSMLLGLEAKAQNNQIFISPSLPSWLSDVTVRGLPVNDNKVNFRVKKMPDGGYDVQVGSSGEFQVIISG